MNELQLQKLVSLFDYNNVDIDISYFLKNELNNFNDFESIQNYLKEQGAFNVDIIYYSVAIDFLAQNDASLKDSLNMVLELGYSIENLSSEILASILASDLLTTSFYDLQEDINEILNN